MKVNLGESWERETVENERNKEGKRWEKLKSKEGKFDRWIFGVKVNLGKCGKGKLWGREIVRKMDLMKI